MSYAPEDLKEQIFVHVATRPGEPVRLGRFDQVVSAEYDAPMIYLIVQVPAMFWDEDHPQWER
jgi:hypothetical protein